VRRFVFFVLTVAGLFELSCISMAMPQESAGPTIQARGPLVRSFTLGVLRRDGVVIPIVSYGVGGWGNRWPAPGYHRDIPIALADSPKGWWPNGRPIAEWTAWPMRGQSRAVHVRNFANLIVECQPHVGLQTDYQSAERAEPPRIQPYPKDGLATSGDVSIEPVTVLDSQSPEWAAVSAEVTARVTAAEPGLLKEARLHTPIPDKLRASTLFSLEVLFSSPDVEPGATVLYFEGVKRYPPQATLPSGLMTYAVGFARIGKTSAPELELSATLSDRRREGLVYSLALGSFRVDGRLFWVVQRSAWGYERFDVVEIRQDEILTIFKTPGGICQ
jgi:hypothetical protein